VTITATPVPAGTPPRVDIAIAVPVGSVMQSVSLYRLDAAGSTLVRSQPSAGFDSRSVSDYECPYGVATAYQWTTTYVNPAAITQLWQETWANLAAWTTAGASWAVSGGSLVWTGSDDPTATVTRAVTSGRYQIVFAAPPTGVQTINFGGFYIDVVGSRLVAGAQVAPFVRGTGAWTISVSGTGVSITTTAGTYSVVGTVAVTRVQFAGAVATISATSVDFAVPTGTGAGQGTDGFGVAVDPVSGNILIPDTNLQRVLVYTAAGVYINTFGTAGTGNGQFTGMRLIVIDASRNVFITDGVRIQSFAWNSGTSNYVYSAKVGTAGTGNGQFAGGNIFGLAVDTAGLVYASDYGNNRVQIFTNALVYSTQFGTVGISNGLLKNPGDVTVDSAGNIYVADSPTLDGAGRIQQFTSSFVWVQTYPIGTGVGSIFFEYSMFARGLTLYVVSSPTASVANQPMQVQKFTSTGTYIGTIANVGPGGTSLSQNTLAIHVTTTGDIVLNDTGIGSSPATGARIRRWAQTKAAVSATTLNQFGATATITETSAAVTLSPASAWFVHPATPSLSVPVGNGVDTSIRTISTVTEAATSTNHIILGSPRPVPTTNGPRLADATQLILQTNTDVARANLKALLQDQTPILIRVPPALSYGFDDGFYAVGDYAADRTAQRPGSPRRVHTLPLQAVDSPVVSVINSGWSYATLALAEPNYTQVLAAFASYALLVTNTRNPGF
jgi:hypothetical protein